MHQARFQRRLTPWGEHQKGHRRYQDKGQDQWEEWEIHLKTLSSIASGFVKDLCVEVAWDISGVYWEKTVCEWVFWESH